MTIGENRDYIRVLLYSYYTTITGWRVLLSYKRDCLAIVSMHTHTDTQARLSVKTRRVGCTAVHACSQDCSRPAL